MEDMHISLNKGRTILPVPGLLFLVMGADNVMALVMRAGAYCR